ncbi:DUF1294 domain-containing protein [Roseateles sp. BYS180W]|uniref:DUF1294 domain-containing protein n=1 Tax=Roseateles rivi TaxID=3299028 RepID=A0ABW7FXT1_9BURK
MSVGQVRQQGRLVHWNPAKGYGFIAPSGGGDKVFVPRQAFERQAQAPRLGDLLSFVLVRDAQGKPQAQQVRVLSARAAKTASPSAPSPVTPSTGNGDAWSLWLVPGFAALVGLTHLAWPLPRGVWSFYMAMSMATFVVYALDRRAARLGRWRVAENTLHLLALLGGWPGALLARRALRHKIRKLAFTRRFWCTVAGNILVFVLVFTPLLTRFVA